MSSLSEARGESGFSAIIRGESGLRSAIRGESGLRPKIRGESDANISESGFTVIEMLIAFTILAIVSGSLFQMFFVSAGNNVRAVNMDMANSLAISTAEIFKGNENLGTTGMFSIQDDAVTGFTWRSENGDRFVKYYDDRWNELELSIPAGGVEAEAPENSVFMLEAELGDSPGASPELNYVAASLSLNLNVEHDYRLVINENAGEIEAIFNGIPQVVDKSRIGRILSVNIEYTTDGAQPKHIAVVNRTGITVNVNVFGVPETGASDAGTDGGTLARGKYIDVTPVTGSISVMYLDEYAKSGDSLMRKLKVTVREYVRGWVDLADIEASRYVPG